MSFRGRLVSAATAVTLLTLGVALVAIYLSVNDSQQDQLDAALVAEAAEEAREAGSQGGDELVISNRPGPMANDVGPLTKYAVIYGPGGSIVAATPTFRGQPPQQQTWRDDLGQPFDAWVGVEHLRAVRVPIPGQPGSTLLLGAPRTDLDGDAAFLARAMLLVLGVSVVWTIGLGTWIVLRLTRDHERIIAVARRVAAGDLSARVGQSEGDREIAQLAHDIDEMIDRLSLLVTSQRRFIAHAAHELRSPLTTLYGELSLALRRDRDAAAYRETIAEALTSTRQLRDLAEDLLALARLGAGPDQSAAPVELLATARQAVAAADWILKARGIRAQVNGDEVCVQGHARDLERMLRNLVENAGRHAKPGGEVHVTAGAANGIAWVRVADDGAGVEPQDRERIFEPFFRAAAERAQQDGGGAGLGLAIAQEIAQLHGGSIELIGGGPGGVFEARLAVGTTTAP